MFDIEDPRGREAEARPATGTRQLRQVRDALACLTRDVGDSERVDQIRLLEELKSAAAAAQARVAADFHASQVRRQRDEGMPERASRPWRREPGGTGEAGVAGAGTSLPGLVTHPRRRAAADASEQLQAGRITEWRAQIVARETAWLSLEHRRAVDEEVAPRLEEWGDRRVEAEVKKCAYRLDPHGYLSRLSRAEEERRVTLRPAPDCMSSLNALLPVAQGVSVLAALRRQADSLRSQGDDRTRDQIMADTLVERVTGQTSADAVPVRVELVMTDQTLVNAGGGSDEPAHLIGCGTIPAELARRLVRVADEKADAWVRRLYADPDGRLVSMESTSRRFEGGLGEFLVIRDQICRTPWCGAPVRHGDHVISSDAGGPTAEINGEGLCAACNQAKEAPGLAGLTRSGGWRGCRGRDRHPDRTPLPKSPSRSARDIPAATSAPGARGGLARRAPPDRHGLGGVTRPTLLVHRPCAPTGAGKSTACDRARQRPARGTTRVLRHHVSPWGVVRRAAAASVQP